MFKLLSVGGREDEEEEGNKESKPERIKEKEVFKQK